MKDCPPLSKAEVGMEGFEVAASWGVTYLECQKRHRELVEFINRKNQER